MVISYIIFKVEISMHYKATMSSNKKKFMCSEFEIFQENVFLFKLAGLSNCFIILNKTS